MEDDNCLKSQLLVGIVSTVLNDDNALKSQLLVVGVVSIEG